MDEELRGTGPTAASMDIEAADEELYQEVREFFIALLKAIRASQFYLQGNPILHQFVEDLRGRLENLWDRVPALAFGITESEIHWRGRAVYHAQSMTDNVAFEFYKDGIRLLTLHPGAERDELRDFLDVLRMARQLKEGDEDDLLTLLWHRDFQHIQYEYVDVLADEELPDLPSRPMGDDEQSANLPQLPELELAPEWQTQTKEDFEPALYFLDDEEISRLQLELRGEWDRDPQQAVVTALLDQFEIGDEDRRYDIVRILRDLLPRVLASGDFVLVAYILQDLTAVAGRHEDPSVQERVDELGEELSRPDVVEQLVRMMEDGAVHPSSEALATMLSVLRPEAMVVLIRSLPSIVRQGTREKLQETVERLGRGNPEFVRRLLVHEDPRVAGEAARMVARLEMVDAVDALADLIERPDENVRLAAVESLTSLRSSMSGKPLLAALGDSSRKVRVAAAKGLSMLKFRPAAEGLERYINDRDLWERDLTEQLAFFEAYALAAGEDAVRPLSRMLNGRRFLWFRYPGQLRACAARALGLIPGEAAAEALSRGAADKDPMVRSAIQTARTG